MPAISYTLGLNWNPEDNTQVEQSLLLGVVGLKYNISADMPGGVIWAHIDTRFLGLYVSQAPTGSTLFAVNFDFSDKDVYVELRGDAVNDILRLGQGGGLAVGGAGDDLIIAGALADQLQGGDGIDTLSYEASTAGVSVDLATGYAGLGFAQGDVFSGFENLRGSAFADLLKGDNGANRLIGGGGFDSLHGGGGDDRLVLVETGSVDGGDGFDILILESGPRDYVFGARDIVGVEQINLLDGVSADVSLLASGPGAFRLLSLDGGGASFTATRFGDSIRLGAGDDTVDAGAGRDSVFVFDGGSATIDGGLGYDTLYVQSGAHAFSDETLKNVEMTVVRAGASLDLGDMTTAMKITSTSAAAKASTIVGTAGNDQIRLGAGGDDVTGGAGDDRLIGGAGADVFRFNAAGFGRDQVTADLAMDRVDLAGVATGVGDLGFRVAQNGLDVVVSIGGLANTDAIFLKGVALEAVQSAAADGFFTF